MIDAVRGPVVLLGRGFRLIHRQPVAIAMMVLQPLVWLLIYGQLFHTLPRLGGFGTTNYLEYLAPGIAVFTAFNHGAWEGGGVVQDLERGTIDRFLATPLPPNSLLWSRSLQAAIVGAAQASFVIVVSLIFGARLRGGVIGFLVIITAAVLVCTAFAGLNHALALVTRRLETMTMVGLFTTFPLMFSSTMFTSAAQMPTWMQHVATVNPVNWAVEAARSAMLDTTWPSAMAYLAALAGLMLIMQALAALALSRYHRSL